MISVHFLKIRVLKFTLLIIQHINKYPLFSALLKPVFLLGYGFVDFESPFAAQRAVAALQSKGIQAQMARVCHFFNCLLYYRSYLHGECPQMV